MKLTNYHGIVDFIVVDNTDQYYLKELKSGHIIKANLENLAQVKGVRRDQNNDLILPGQQLTLYCKWQNNRWQVYPLKPGQELSPEKLIETQMLELKSTGLNTFEEDVCAMANSDGGTIIWGLNDNGEATEGVKSLLAKYGNEDKLTCMLRNRLKQNTNTLLFMEIKFDFTRKNNLPILKITVPKSNEIVLFKDQLFVRAANTSQRLTGDRMLSFIKESLKPLLDKHTQLK